MSNITTRSHYLPQTYLKHFLLEESLFMYKKGEKFFKEGITPEQRVHEIKGEKALLNFGLENNLYDPEIPGVTSNDLEEIFQEYGENSYNELVQCIEDIKVGSALPQNIKERLCTFMAAMRVRTPQFKAEVNEMASVFTKHEMEREFGNMPLEEIIASYKEIKGEEISLERAAKVKEMFKNKSYELKYPNGHFIQIALMMLEKHIDIFQQMTFHIYKSDDRYFITSDNPIVFFVPPEKVNVYVSARALVSPYTELFFSITKNIGVHLTWRKETEKILSAKRVVVDAFNYNLSHNSFNFIFSPMKMNDLEKFTKEFFPYPFKVVIH